MVLIFSAFFMNNLLVWRSKKYTIPYGLEEGTQTRKALENPRIVYWVCENPQQKNPDDWVVLLHSFGRNSARMVERAAIYWKRRYSLVFVDSRSHGQSEYTITSQGFTYAEDAQRVIEAEGLDNPLIHGLSVGAIAGTIAASKVHVRALVAEALVNNYYDMVVDTITKANLPRFMFLWVAKLLFRLNLPFEENRPSRLLPLIKAPIFLIHGAEDDWFTVEKHFKPNFETIKDRNDVFTWVVPKSSHSQMAEHPDYFTELGKFLDFVEAFPPSITADRNLSSQKVQSTK